MMVRWEFSYETRTTMTDQVTGKDHKKPLIVPPQNTLLFYGFEFFFKVHTNFC